MQAEKPTREYRLSPEGIPCVFSTVIPHATESNLYSSGEAASNIS